MKKIFSILLCICLILSVGSLSAVAQINYCNLFNDQWSCLTEVNSFGSASKPWSASDIALVTSRNLADFEQYRNAEKDTEFETFYSVPKETFEALANKLFDVKVDLTTANYSGVRNITFDASTQNYIVTENTDSNTHYHICGYKEANGEYEVYMQKVANEYLDEYIKCTATISGGVAKLISCQEVTAIPSKDELITQHTDFSSSDESAVSSTESKVENDAVSSNASSSDISSENSSSDTSSESSSETTSSETELTVLTENKQIKIAAEKGTFPEGVKLNATEITDKATLQVLTDTVKGVANKFVAFDITAKSGLSLIQPIGKLIVTFSVPDGYNMDKLLVLYVDDEGKVDRLSANVDKTERTITVELTHLSTYLVAEAAEEGIASSDTSDENTLSEKETEEGSSGITIRIIAAVVAVALLGGAVAWYLLYYKKKATASTPDDED